jgi:hypothetical protein
VASSPTVETRKVPKAALAFHAGQVQFAAKGANGNSPTSIRARSGKPLAHWYWGKCVHDMAGFQPAAPSIPIDYCHNDSEVLGYLNKFQPSNEGLDCDGEVVPVGDDRAAQVLEKSSRGVPYQASIYFDQDSLVIEQLGQGAKARVNGYELEGPAIIFRQWMLRGVAICPYGYDVNTSTRLSAGGLAGEIELSISQLTAEAAMDPATNPTTPPAPAAAALTPAANPAPATPAEKPVDARVEFQATLKKFTEKFGASNGAKWAAEGLSYEAALEKHAEAQAAEFAAGKKELEDRLAAANKTIADQASKLAAVPRGEAEPVSFSAPEQHAGGQAAPKPTNGLGALGAFAAGLKLPGAATK